MSSIDQRTVKMSFDNNAFEQKAHTTLGTLEKLKQSLNFNGAAQGMENIRNVANSVNFESLSQNVEFLKDRFSVLGEFAHNVFMNILNTAVDVGRGIADAIALEPMKQGFSEYELQMNSVQTIMASTGESVDTVNGYLDELNTYADKTIYSFSDMTQNIGKFTNAGVKLDDAVAAIQGISNVAAVSGANTNEASRAMYNFAQALSAGYVKLIDWKSIENANMATVEFKQALLDTALAMGKVTKEGDDYVTTTTNAKGETSEAFNATKNFNDMLQYQWMTTDVLTQTLQNYSTDVREMSEEEKNAYEEKLRGLGYTEEQIKHFEELGQKAADSAKDVKTFGQLIDTLKESLGSGWTKTWQLIIGDLEDAKVLWTEVSEILGTYIGKSADARNAMVKEWVDNGGRIAIINGLRNAFNALVSVVKPIKEAFNNIFPAKTGKELADYSKNFEKFTNDLKLNGDQVKDLKKKAELFFQFLSNNLSRAINIGKSAIEIFKQIGAGLRDAFDGRWVNMIHQISSRFYDLSKSAEPTKSFLNSIYKLFKGLGSAVQSVVTVLFNFGLALYDSVVKVFANSTPQITSFVGNIRKIGVWFTKLSRTLDNFDSYQYFFTLFSNIAISVKNLAEAFAKFINLDGIVNGFKNLFTATKDNEQTPTILERVASAIKNMSEKIREFSESVRNSAFDVFGKIVEKLHLNEFGDRVKGFFNGIVEFVKSIDIIKVASDAVGKLANKVKELFGEFKPSDVDPKTVISTIFNVALFKKILDILDKIKKKLDKSVPDQEGLFTKLKKTIKEATESISENLETLKNSLVDTFSAIQNTANANALLKIAIALAIMVGSLKVLSDIDTDRLIPAIAALTGLLLELVGMLKIFELFNNFDVSSSSKISSAMVKIAAAILILSMSVEKLGKLEPDQLSRGLLAVMLLLAEMTAVGKSLAKSNNDIAKGAGTLIKLALAVVILTRALKSIADVDPDRLVPAMVALISIIAALAGVAALLSNQKIVQNPQALSKVAGGILIFVTAVKILAGIAKDLSAFTEEELKRGIAAVIVLMGSLVATAWLLTNEKVIKMPYQLTNVAKGILIFVAAVKILADIAKDIASIPEEEMKRGLAGVTVILGALVLSAAALTNKKFIQMPYMLSEVSKGILLFVAAIKILSGIAIQFSTIPVDKLAVGIGGLAVIILALVLAAGKLSGMNLKGLNDAALGMMAFMGSVKTMSEVAISMSAIPFDKLVTGLGGLIVVTALLVGVSEILSNEALDPGRIAAVSAGLIVFGIAVGALSLSISLLGSLGLPELIVGFIGVAGAIGIFAAAAVLLTPIVPQMAALSATMLAFGAAIALIGVGVGVAAAGLAMLFTSIAAGGFIVIEILNGLIGLIPTLAQAWAEAFVVFITTLAENGPQIQEALVQLFEIIVTAIGENLALIGNVLLECLTQFLESAAEYVPRMAEAGLAIIEGLLTAIANHIGSIAEAAATIAIEFMKGITEKLPEIIDAAFKLIIAFIDGLAKAVDENHNKLWDAIGHLLESIAKAIWDGLCKLDEAAKGLLDHLADALKDGWDRIKNAGANLVRGFIDGIKSLGTEIWNAGCNLVDTAWKAITGAAEEHSPSRLTFGGGVNFVLGFINGMKDQFGPATKTATQLVYGTWSAIQDGLSSDMNFAPTITPVMDLSDIQNGIVTAKDLMYSMPDTVGISASISNDKNLKRQMVDLMSSQNDYSSILAGMSDLRSELSSFGDKLAQMQIVMDSGALVGAIAQPMDQTLGMRQAMVGRGVL